MVRSCPPCSVTLHHKILRAFLCHLHGKPIPVATDMASSVNVALTHATVLWGIASSRLARQVDLRGLRTKLSRILLTFSSEVHGCPVFCPLQTQPVSSNCWYQRWMLLALVINAKTPSKCTLHCSYGFSLAELQNAERFVLWCRHLANDWGQGLFMCWERHLEVIIWNPIPHPFKW